MIVRLLGLKCASRGRIYGKCIENVEDNAEIKEQSVSGIYVGKHDIDI